MLKKIIFLVMVISLAGNVYAGSQVYTYWKGLEGGDWNTPTNWQVTPAGGYTNPVPYVLDPVGGPQGAFFGKAGFKGPVATSPGITGTVATDQIVIGGAITGILTIGSGGTVNISEFVNMGNISTDLGVLNMNGGTLNCGVMIPSLGRLQVGYAGNSTLNMTSGVINLTSSLTIAVQSGSTGYVHLDGGTIYAADLLMNYNAHLDISGGTLILDGNDLPTITTFIGAGKITAYDGAGTILKDYNITNTNKTTVRGYFANPKATNPNPGNGSSNLSISTTLNWTAGDGAVSRNVYFGTASPGDSQGNQTATTFIPGTLSYGTTYYWRIDEVSGSGTTTGDVWSFSTTSGQASTPSPTTGATNVSMNPTLTWTAGEGITSHNVYFGTANPPAAQGNQSTTSFSPGALTANVTYYWRIDEVAGTVITGPVWSFTTAQLKATSPNPANGAADRPLSPTLSWTAGAGAASHDVYFGTANPPPSIGNQTGTTYSPGTLTAMTTYYWRIDEKDGSNNTTTGDIWSFTTGNPSPIYPYLTWKGSPTNSIVVNWWNPDGTGDSSVDYGSTNSYGSTVNVATVTDYHHVELTGLTPGATYHYKIRSNDGTVGSDNTFTTADVNIASFTFAVYGDPRGIQPPSDSTQYHTRHKQLCDWMAGQNIAFALETGDIVWAGGNTDGNCPGFYKEYFKAEQNFSKTKVIMPTVGNHEIQPNGLGDAGYPYFSIYGSASMPGNGPAGVNGKAYSFDYGNAHFVCMPSYQVSLPTAATWLAADLNDVRVNHPNIKWIFAWMHAPMYTTSGHAGRADELAAWGPIFDQYHVDIVFAGHNHVYERFRSIKADLVVDDGEGTVYITNGIGGAEFNNSVADPKLVTWFGASNLNKTAATIITINGNYLTSQTIPNLTGVPVDAFQLNKVPVGDFNLDGTVDMKDLGIFVGHWLDTGLWP